MLRATRLPLPLRRLIWLIGLNFGRQRANYFGSFGVTSVAAYGAGELHALSPGPFIVSYGVVGPEPTIDVVIRWDHRVADAALIARTLTRLEQVLNTEIAVELRAQRQPAEPVRASGPDGVWAVNGTTTVLPGPCKASNPESRDSGFAAAATPRNDALGPGLFIDRAAVSP
jgi:hypothetical protein